MFLREELSEYDNYFRNMPTSVEQSRVSSKNQLLHLTCPFFLNGWKDSDKNDNNIKECNVQWVFDQLAVYFGSIFGLRESHGLWVLL